MQTQTPNKTFFYLDKKNKSKHTDKELCFALSRLIKEQIKQSKLTLVKAQQIIDKQYKFQRIPILKIYRTPDIIKYTTLIDVFILLGGRVCFLNQPK